MPDLEPITREEMLLDGQDLEPITRKEMFIKRIYDKTQVVPEPITREEMFLKKAGDETTDVTIEQLNVSENGTYSESGKAYSPVIVDVSLPENAYLLKDIPNTPCDIATFTDGSDLPLASLKVGIEPIQSGSGDPSPTNIRPISGWDEVNVVVSPTTDAEDGHTYTIQFTDSQGESVEVFGGSVDVVNGGEQPKTLGSVDLGSLNWSRYDFGGTYAFYVNLPSKKSYYTKGLCEMYPIAPTPTQAKDLPDKSMDISINSTYIYIRDDDYTNVTAFKEAVSGKKLVYELATPSTFTSQPTSIKSLEGNNNVWGDTGKIEELEYFSKEV